MFEARFSAGSKLCGGVVAIPEWQDWEHPFQGNLIQGTHVLSSNPVGRAAGALYCGTRGWERRKGARRLLMGRAQSSARQCQVSPASESLAKYAILVQLAIFGAWLSFGSSLSFARLRKMPMPKFAVAAPGSLASQALTSRDKLIAKLQAELKEKEREFSDLRAELRVARETSRLVSRSPPEQEVPCPDEVEEAIRVLESYSYTVKEKVTCTFCKKRGHNVQNCYRRTLNQCDKIKTHCQFGWHKPFTHDNPEIWRCVWCYKHFETEYVARHYPKEYRDSLASQERFNGWRIQLAEVNMGNQQDESTAASTSATLKPHPNPSRFWPKHGRPSRT